jgi:pimeloyl-ACP methyl ester carboxylesterase
MISLASFAQDLQQPEYVHVLLNPVPVYGMAVGLLALVIALFFRARPARITALVLIAASAVSVWPVAHYGEEGYDRVLAMEDVEGGAWLEAHMERAETYESVFYALAVLALGAIFIPIKWPRADGPLAIATLVVAAVTLGLGGWIAYAGGKVRHSEFRNSPPPEVEEHEDEHQH